MAKEDEAGGTPPGSADTGREKADRSGEGGGDSRRSKFSHHTLFDIPIQIPREALEAAVEAAAGTTAGGASSAIVSRQEAAAAREARPSLAAGAVVDQQQKPARTRVEYDDAGRVAEVVYPDNSSREFTYQGMAVSEILHKDPQGQVIANWVRGDGDYLEHRPDPQGALAFSGRVWQGQISIDQNTGDVIYQQKGSNVRIIEHASSGLTIAAHMLDGWAVTRDRLGRVVKVEYADGLSRTFEYDAKGLQSVTESDGLVYARQEDGSWLKRDQNTRSTEQFPERITVNSRGEVLYEGPEYRVIVRPDGTRLGTEFDAQRRELIVLVSHPEQGEQQFGYDDQGRLVAIQWADGSKDIRKEGGLWYRESSDETLELDQALDIEGNVVARHNDGIVETLRPDGSVHIEYPNGTHEEHHRDGTLLWKRTPEQRVCRLDAEAATYTYEIRRDDTLESVARDRLRADNGTADYEPSQEEIESEVERLIRLNILAKPVELRPGDTLVLYERTTSDTTLQ
jgi:YD repeat-containing protein